MSATYSPTTSLSHPEAKLTPYYILGCLAENQINHSLHFAIENLELISRVDFVVVEFVSNSIAGYCIVLFDEFDCPLVEGLFLSLIRDHFVGEVLQLLLTFLYFVVLGRNLQSHCDLHRLLLIHLLQLLLQFLIQTLLLLQQRLLL